MSFDPIAFKELSYDLYHNSAVQYYSDHPQRNQALFRTVVSRVYYAILLEIKKRYGIDTEGISDSHQKIIWSLDDVNLRNTLHDMKDIREKADYNLDRNIINDDIDEQFVMFDKILNAI